MRTSRIKAALRFAHQFSWWMLVYRPRLWLYGRHCHQYHSTDNCRRAPIIKCRIAAEMTPGLRRATGDGTRRRARRVIALCPHCAEWWCERVARGRRRGEDGAIFSRQDYRVLNEAAVYLLEELREWRWAHPSPITGAAAAVTAGMLALEGGGETPA